MHQAVLDWIESRQTDHTDHNPYSTHRNSTYTVTKWRDEIDISKVTMIQSMCEAAMRKAGYNLISKNDDLINSSFKLTDRLTINDI